MSPGKQKSTYSQNRSTDYILRLEEQMTLKVGGKQEKKKQLQDRKHHKQNFEK